MLKLYHTGKCFGVAAIFITMLFACGSDSQQDAEGLEDELLGEGASEIEGIKGFDSDGNKIKKIGKVFYTIPSPLEMNILIKKAGATYNKELLNSTDKVSDYSTNNSMALNLGIYGADLSYSSIFEQTQETMKYFAAAKILADGIGITSAFGLSTMERIERNINNRDSLVEIISDAYWETDAYLKENNRSGVSGLIIAGGWIEGLYIATKLLDTSPGNDEIKSRIGEQKLTLNNLIAMLENYGDDSVSDILNELSELNEIFNGVELTYARQDPTTNPDTRVTTINTTSKISISDEQLKSISEKIQNIRNNIVK